MKERNGQVVWFTGLSGAGKTTLAKAVAGRLKETRWEVELIDGDEVRKQISVGLGFSREARAENARRAACIAATAARHADFVLVAMIAPYRADRAAIAKTLHRYCEIYVNAPLAVCEARDPKGLYRKARAGHVKNFTGIDDPYEPPLRPALECRTDLEAVERCVDKVLGFLVGRGSAAFTNCGEFVRSALDADPGLKATGAARRACITPRTLANRLRKEENTTYRAIRDRSLATHAKQLLLRGLSVKDVATELGFRSPEAFERFFRRVVGCSPSQFRMRGDRTSGVKR